MVDDITQNNAVYKPVELDIAHTLSQLSLPRIRQSYNITVLYAMQTLANQLELQIAHESTSVRRDAERRNLNSGYTRSEIAVMRKQLRVIQSAIDARIRHVKKRNAKAADRIKTSKELANLHRLNAAHAGAALEELRRHRKAEHRADIENAGARRKAQLPATMLDAFGTAQLTPASIASYAGASAVSIGTAMHAKLEEAITANQGLPVGIDLEKQGHSMFDAMYKVESERSEQNSATEDKEKQLEQSKPEDFI
jgi:hypothetical protein